jgi:hypothetical protein
VHSDLQLEPTNLAPVQVSEIGDDSRKTESCSSLGGYGFREDHDQETCHKAFCQRWWSVEDVPMITSNALRPANPAPTP